MISEGYLRRYVDSSKVNREIALLDVCQEYLLEHLRREGLFSGTLVFKGGTALRKYVFGPAGRFSTDLDFALLSGDPADVDLVLDLVNGASLHGVRFLLEGRKGANARIRLQTPLGEVNEPAAISIRLSAPWLPIGLREPVPFEYLDRGLAP